MNEYSQYVKNSQMHQYSQFYNSNQQQQVLSVQNSYPTTVNAGQRN